MEAGPEHLLRRIRRWPGDARAAAYVYWRSVAGLAAILTLAVVLLLFLGAMRIVDLPFVLRRWDSLWRPAWLGVSLTIIAFLLGLVTALPLGLARAYLPGYFRRDRVRGAIPFRTAREVWGMPRAIIVTAFRKIRAALSAAVYGVASGYIEGVRGTPFYVQMWLVFFGTITVYQSTPPWFQSSVSAFFAAMGYPPIPEQLYLAGLLALYLNTAGYQAEVLRGGFQSVGQGQVDGAKAVGMKGRQVFLHITLPQALRLVVLPLTNEWISLFKASSILSAIAVIELLFQSRQLGVNEGHPIEAFIMIAAMYLLINVTLGRAVGYVERKKRIPGLGTPGLRIESARRAGRRSTPGG